MTTLKRAKMKIIGITPAYIEIRHSCGARGRLNPKVIPLPSTSIKKADICMASSAWNTGADVRMFI
jgi:hypothetical protein